MKLLKIIEKFPPWLQGPEGPGDSQDIEYWNAR